MRNDTWQCSPKMGKFMLSDFLSQKPQRFKLNLFKETAYLLKYISLHRNYSIHLFP